MLKKRKKTYMEQKLKFAPNVMLIDASYLDRTVKGMSTYFAPLVNRDLPKADLPLLLECLALDGSIQLGENEIQVIFVYEPDEGQMKHCAPSDLEKELHNVAFKSQLGEFSLFAFQPSDMASREELFTESLQLAGVSDDVKRIILVPDEDSDLSALKPVLAEIKKKESVTLFGMNPPAFEMGCAFEMLGFAVLQSLGIRSEEL